MTNNFGQLEGGHGDAHDLISHLYFFAEHLNAYVAGLVKRGFENMPPLQSVILDIRKYLAAPESSWSDRSELIKEAARLGLTPKIDPAIINAIARYILSPAEISIDQSNGEWRLSGRAFLPTPNIPDELHHNFWFYTVGDLLDLSTTELEACSTDVASTAKDQRSFFWEELINPILFAQGFLIEAEGMRSEEAANHLIQRWFRKHFHLPFTVDMKYEISNLAQITSDIFFADKGNRYSEDMRRSHTIGALLFISLMSRQLLTSLSLDPEEAGKRAVGFYISLRFSRVLRVRYQWFESAVITDDAKSIGRPYQLRQCLSALGPVEYSFLVTRIFGSISNISGLNFIFRGGILPRNSSGRSMVVLGTAGAGKTVLALQKLSGIAARGGLAVYMSFEETRELLVDRIVMFDLMKDGRFELPASEAEFFELAHAIRTGRLPHTGVLFLYGSEEGVVYDVPNQLRRLRDRTQDVWRWRSVVLDSVNALEIGDRRHRKMFDGRSSDTRGHLRELIHDIENNGYLGLFLSEPGAKWLGSLPFLADTVLELGFEERTRSRWIEICKCRSQNFHAGRHSLRILGGEGLKIYPSLAALRSSLRKRVVSGLSGQRRIHIPHELEGVVRFHHGPPSLSISEKASNLIVGPPSSGKSLLAIATALSKARSNTGVSVRGKGELPSLLIVTFRTAETKVQQVIGEHPDLKAHYDEGRVSIKWFAPGDNISAEQFVFAVRKLIKNSRRRGQPIDRVVFDEVESAEYMLPHIDREPLFWTTILQFLGSEALTSFFVFETGGSDSRALRELRAGVDYIFRTEGMKGDRGDMIKVALEKLPDSEL